MDHRDHRQEERIDCQRTEGRCDAKSVQEVGGSNGRATLKLRVNRVKERLCFNLTSNLKNITGAWIHKGEEGEIARPIITLFNTRENGSVKGCEHNVRPRLIKRLKRKPGLHYADVTTRGYPDGAVRGQLR